MKTILITGITKGIGRALAQQFLKEGHRVIGTTKEGDTEAKDSYFAVHKLDLSQPDSIQECAKAISSTGTKIDILINNAGVLLDDEEKTLIIPKLRQTLEVNLIGTTDFTEQIIPSLNNSAHIVFISSQAGSLADMKNFEHSHAPYRYPAYKISKAALNMYSTTLALRFQHEGKDVTVSAIHPGWVRTDMGGDEATTTPDEAASDIFKLAISKPETGQFWYKGEKFPW
jgi:NAD(P)-dependent dehydrogenase (short-subunit alcohol dehydrogenase family)